MPLLDISNAINWRSNPLAYYLPNHGIARSSLSNHPVISNCLRIGMMNIQSLQLHHQDLTSFILDNNIAVCSVSETRIRQDNDRGHPFIKAY